MNRLPSNAFAPRVQRGFTLVELLVALLIGLFLVGGLLTIVQDNRRTFSSQNQLSQLQDAERVAMTMITDVIQSAGYFPDPTTNTAASALPVAGAIAAGQSLFGAIRRRATGRHDHRALRHQQRRRHRQLHRRQQYQRRHRPRYTNVFSVVNGQLVCTLNGTAYQLVGSVPNAATGVLSNGIVVNNLSVLYGINNGGTAGNVNTYVTANNVPSWFNVISVQVSLTFNNPLYSANPVQGQGNAAAVSDGLARHQRHESNRDLDMQSRRQSSRSTQHGVVLISSLLLLLVVTIMALSMFRSFGIQERIGGNVREKQRALQVANSAQQYAEWWLANQSSAPIAVSNGIAASADVVCTNTLINVNTGGLPTICNNTLVNLAGVSTALWPSSGTNVGVIYTPPGMNLASRRQLLHQPAALLHRRCRHSRDRAR